MKLWSLAEVSNGSLSVTNSTCSISAVCSLSRDFCILYTLLFIHDCTKNADVLCMFQNTCIMI